MSARRTRMTEAERKQRRGRDRETSISAVRALKSSEGWQAWLRVRRHFHSYSLTNQLLWSSPVSPLAMRAYESDKRPSSEWWSATQSRRFARGASRAASR